MLDPKHLNEQDQKDTETQTHYRDREVEPVFLIDNPDNDLKTLDLKQTLKDLDKVMLTGRSNKGGPDDDVTEPITTWTTHHKQI
jgi:hypothetical protein